MSTEKGRFSCYIDLSKSKKTAQAYFFLKGLGNLRQDIIIDMVLRTLGDDISLDFEHMSRAEILSVYNKNVYTKAAAMPYAEKGSTSALPSFDVAASVPKEEARSPRKENEESEMQAPYRYQEAQEDQTDSKKVPDTPERAETVTEIESEKPFQLEDEKPQSDPRVGLRQVSVQRRQPQTVPNAFENFSSTSESVSDDDDAGEDNSDDLDDIPDDNSAFITDMIQDSFQEIKKAEQ